MKSTHVCTWLATLCALCAMPSLADQTPLFEVPRLSGIRVDGDPSEWGDRGFRVGILTSLDGQVLPAEDLDAAFRLGWDEKGLLLLLSVADNAGAESDDEGSLWTRDSAELFVAAGRGSAEHYQVIVGPGIDPGQPALRRALYDHRSRLSHIGLELEAARTRTATGYALEMSFPWKNLDMAPEQGREIAFQLYVNDADGEGGAFCLTWFPSQDAHTTSLAMHRLRLADRPSPPVLAAAGGHYENMRRTRLAVHGVAELANKTVVLREGKKKLAEAPFVAEGPRAVARFELPMPEHAFGTLTALVEDKPLASVALPDPAAERSRALMEIEVHCAPSVFAGAEFPPCGPAQTGSVEDLIGPYEIKTTYYDRDYRIVAAAEKPGRYGAVIDLIPEQGRRVRRFRTLYCQPEGLDWWSYEMKAAAEFPGALGLDPGAVSGQSRLVGEYFKWLLVDSFYRSDQTAPLLAGLAEAEPGAGDPGLSGDAAALDRQWWVGLKRKLYGAEAGQAQTFLAPRPNPGRRAPALRDGSAAEAGLHPDSVAAIDALLGRWAADSDEAFAVLIARRGVVALHKAYGTRQDRPMSVDDPSWMASITKLLSGTLMLLLVDQDLVSLDDPVDRFIPALRGIAVEKPLTIRHLYTHTNGLWGHWGDDLHDFEEIVADYYPYLEVGKNHSYNGAGYALDGKVIEMVSGEALPQFYKEHLLDPLGCAHTYVTDTSGGARSVPLDIARIGQLLLNRGAYGDLEFFREETYAQLLPVRLAAILGPGTQIEWGIGATWFRGEGLGEGTFGHGAASSATLRIDPANELVVVMTRNAAGRRFNEYHPRFLAAVAGALLAEKSPDKMGGKAPERTELAREE